MQIGLRIDVDTLRGTRDGVPSLCSVLEHHSIKASFFFSVGPDNMGRHLWRLLRPAFLQKMLRSKAASLYGWDILLRGTMWPGPIIGEQCSDVIRAVADDGHEIGFHAWDHHGWQTHIDTMSSPTLHHHIGRGIEMLERIINKPPVCTAAPGWKCTNLVLTEKTRFPLTYNSDCRGNSIFYPVVDGVVLAQPQIPTTLPTYDEVIGQGDLTDDTYNEHIFSLLEPAGLNVLTIHAEVEGIARRKLFERFVETALERGIAFVPLGICLRDSPMIESATMVTKEIPGREGWVAYQGSPLVADSGGGN